MTKLSKKSEELKKELENPDIWQDKERAANITKEFAELNHEFEKFDSWQKEIKELEELHHLSHKEAYGDFEKELDEKLSSFEKALNKEEIKIFLAEPHDRKSATISIYSGAGGQDAQDWTAILLRMYQRYCERRGFETKILHQTHGEPSPTGQIGIKSVTMEVVGSYAYGFLKGENGVHRLVRISPFSAQQLRHTSFARVEVLPEFDKDVEKEIEVRPNDLRIETFRASGPGGQYVNRRESAIRITHVPTGIVVSCQSERLQGQNKEKAMRLLYSRLYQLKLRERQEEKSKIRGVKISAEWGNQIRSYVMQPYRLVKDARTKVETSDVDGVLDGRLDEFIDAQVRQLKTHDYI